MPSTAQQPLTLTVAAPLAISTTTVPDATESKAYSFQLQATGGVTPYTWSVFAGALPTGITLSSGGLLSGTPTITGAFNFTAQVTDSGV
jgi:putative Ig domain-containing protein